MTDKEKIKAEVKRRIINIKDYILQPNHDKRFEAVPEQLSYIIGFIDSMEEEPTSEELEEEVSRWMKENCDDAGYFNQIEFARHFAEWQRKRDQETIELAEEHAMLAGMNKMEEEMMKNSIECTVLQSEVDGFKLNGVEICPDGIALDEAKFKIGDKVRVFIVKEE